MMGWASARQSPSGEVKQVKAKAIESVAAIVNETLYYLMQHGLRSTEKQVVDKEQGVADEGVDGQIRMFVLECVEDGACGGV